MFRKNIKKKPKSPKNIKKFKNLKKSQKSQKSEKKKKKSPFFKKSEIFENIFFVDEKKAILSVSPFGEISLRPELSSPPRLRIQGG